jgi:hypothetical protein
MVIDKHTRIQNYFQKIDNLVVSNKIYQKCIDDLIEWLLRNDKVQDDLRCVVTACRYSINHSFRV